MRKKGKRGKREEPPPFRAVIHWILVSSCYEAYVAVQLGRAFTCRAKLGDGLARDRPIHR